MRLKNIGIYTCVVAALLMGYIVSSSGASSKYAANVNGTKIKTATLDAAVGNFIESQKMTGVEIKEEDKEALRKGILEELISAELLYQESKSAELGDLKEEVKG
ncbi:MAG: SurA N-terminal domain-containing protein, partial [Candidatus Omnitrophica bacterium]|nr:SurA N-terminal domain-containing protein [Candidatus Omnitrophota bacterium]